MNRFRQHWNSRSLIARTNTAIAAIVGISVGSLYGIGAGDLASIILSIWGFGYAAISLYHYRQLDKQIKRNQAELAIIDHSLATGDFSQIPPELNEEIRIHHARHILNKDPE